MARKQNGSGAPKDAIALLKADHRKVEDLFEQYEKARSSERKLKLARQACQELIVHSMIEEEIFYPAVAEAVEEDLLHEAYVEHDGAKVMIAELLAGDPDSDEFYDAKLTVLAEEIRHHVKEEEKRGDGMFAQAREAGLDMEALGERMMARKQELMAEIEENGPPPPRTHTLRARSDLVMAQQL